MKPETSQAETPLSYSKQGDKSGVWRVIMQVMLLGLIPLASLAVIGVVVVALVVVIRSLVVPTSFIVEQLIFAIVMIAGLVFAALAFILTIKRALRQIETWRQNGHATRANAGLVALTIVAIIIALPEVIVLFFH
jgi:hypothetical protein